MLKIYFFSLALLVSFLYCTTVQASNIHVEMKDTSVAIGEVISVDIVLDTKESVVNAAELVIKFPSEFLSFVRFDDSKSTLSLWVEEPQLQAPATLHFSGVTPGGIVSNGAVLVRVYFKVEQEGQGNIEVTDASVLLHDGLGTRDSTSYQNVHIVAGNNTSHARDFVFDDELPESFSLLLDRDANVFDGDYFLSFTTKDKGSGMNYYEVKEGWFAQYKKVQSPYRITSQALDTQIYVKAVDQYGNERIAVFYPQNKVPPLEQKRVRIGILIVCSIILLTFFIYRKLRVRA